jgi:two-component system, chemotaxis family, protein-glutamate methylesterase/glutaminase
MGNTLPDSKKPPQSIALANGRPSSAVPSIVAIGVSTGGPRALEQILPRLPADLPVPILIVQHMPVGFIEAFAHRLDLLCSIKVCEASHRELIRPGVAYIAPAGVNMRVASRFSNSKPVITLDRRPDDAKHKPSVDILMSSVAQVFKHRSLGVIMTGMGCDGAEGMTAIFRQGGLTIGQNESSCAVYGMPRACAERGVLARVVSLSDIPTCIVQAVGRCRRPA